MILPAASYGVSRQLMFTAYQGGTSRFLLLILELCRFIPTHKTGLSQHLPAKFFILDTCRLTPYQGAVVARHASDRDHCGADRKKSYGSFGASKEK